MGKRIFTLLLVTCMVIGVFAGCAKDVEQNQGTTTNSTGNSASALETEKFTLKVWSPAEDQNPELGAWLVTMCNQFNELHPEWDITFEYGVCTESDAKKLIPQDIDAAADVFLYSSTGLENLCQASTLTELGGKYREAVEASYPQSMVDCLIFEDGLYGVPMTTNTYFMYYDKSVFTEEDVLSLDAMLTKGKVVFPLTNGFYLGAFYQANGCQFFGPDGKDREAGIQVGGEKGIAVTNMLVDLVKNPNFIVAQPEDAIAMMREGNCNAYICGTWQAAQTEEILGENFGVAVVPSVMIDGVQKQIRPFTSAKAIGVKSTTAHPEAALNLALYLGGYEAQKAHYEMRGYIPCENRLVSEIQNDPICLVDSKTVSEIAIPRSCFTEFSFFWTPAESMGTELRDGVITHDNAADKTEAFNKACNSSGVE